MDINYSKLRDNIRGTVAENVRELRQGRRWTQRELADKLGLSQSRLSELERGAGSFTAEQLLQLLQLFNVSVSRFAPRVAKPDQHLELQNALARVGATHLRESEHVLPSERFDDATRVAREALVLGDPRHVTALAPVLVNEIDWISLSRVDRELRALGLERRLPWLVDNILAALRAPREQALPRQAAANHRRAATVLEQYIQLARRRFERDDQTTAPDDILDSTIRSERTLTEVKRDASDLSRYWGVVTQHRPEDFLAALEAARVDD